MYFITEIRANNDKDLNLVKKIIVSTLNSGDNNKDIYSF